MANRADVAKGREIVARWCSLAEARLEHLTELFESGRWRRYHSERAFLENIREAKTAVETWRALLTREASLDNSAIDLSWLGGRPGSGMPRGEGLLDRAPGLQPDMIEASRPPAGGVAAVSALIEQVLLEGTPAAAEDAPALDHAAMPLLDLSRMQERYPLLRNAL
jgi:uncharacterized repeat protein (TIGR03809 family)